jgi:pilus assembly protein Flp/PilA
MENLNDWIRDEDGQGMVEYALIIGLISITAIVILSSVGKKVQAKFNTINNALS